MKSLRRQRGTPSDAELLQRTRRDPSAFSELYTRHVGDVHETRARERLGLPLDLAAEDGFTEVEERLAPRLALERQLAALPPGEREALELRVIDELPYQELAARLDIQPAVARLRVSRALRRLAHTVPQEEA